MELEWLEPWRKLEDSEWAFLESEFYKELRRDHVLFGIKVMAVGKSDASDDLLLRLYEYALVHLTWLGRQEISDAWPYTQLHRTWHDFLTGRMQDDNFG